MAENVCFTSLREMFPREEVPDKFIRDVLTEVEGMRKQYAKEGKAVYDKAVAQHISQWRETMKISKKAYAEALKKRVSLEADVVRLGPAEAMRRRLAGGGVGANERVNVDTQMQTIHRRYLAKFSNGVKKLKAEGVLRAKTLDKEIMIEMHELGTTGKGGKSGSKMALELAKLFRSLNDEMHADMRRAGMRAGYLDDFLISQSHSADKLRELGSGEKWIEFIEPLLDPDRTFTGALKGNKGRQKKYLMDVYEKLTSYGDNANLGSELTPEGVKIITGRTLGTPKFSPRSLHFKDGAAFFEYNSRFGERGLGESFMRAMRRSSQFQGFANLLGPDPEGAFTSFMKRHGKNMGVIEKTELEKIWKNLTGKVNEGSDNMVAQTFSVGRSLLNSILLGKAVLSAFPDFVVSISKLKSITGGGFFESARELTSAYLTLATSSAERQSMGLMMEIQAEGILGATFSRLGVGSDAGPRLAAQISHYTYKFNGLEAHTNIAKWAFGVTLGAEMNIRLNTNYGDLPGPFRNYLNSNGIGFADWSRLQKIRAANPQILGDLNGKKFLATGEVRALDPALADKFSFMYNDSANLAVPTPGVRQVAMANQGLEAGTWAGQLMRTMMHLKSFPLTVLRSVDNIVKSAAPEGHQARFRDAVSTKSGGWAMMELAVGATALGGMALMAKDVAAGREPRDVFTGEGLVDSFIQGGAGGLYADLIFGAYDIPGRNFTSMLLGPTGSLANDITKIYAEARDAGADGGKWSKAGKNAMKLAMRNIPGQNLFYLEAGLRYMVLDNMNEAMNPGYRAKRAKRMRKQEALFSDDGQSSLLEF